MRYLTKYKFTLLGILLGAVGGYAYYYFVGCASGNRSGQATRFLKEHGVDCSNGGSWLDVNCNC